MNWGAIKHIYRMVLISNHKIEYLGDDKYRITVYYKSGEKYYEIEYKNDILHGRYIKWDLSGSKYWEDNYKNGKND